MKTINNSGDSYIIFELAGTKYAINSQYVKQMEMIENITPVPNAPSFVEGVIISRGQVIPAINLRKRFGFDKIDFDIKTRLIVVNINNRSLGLIVDTARDFIKIDKEQIKEVPETITALSGKYLSGFVTVEKEPILIFNIEEAINLTEIVEKV